MISKVAVLPPAVGLVVDVGVGWLVGVRVAEYAGGGAATLFVGVGVGSLVGVRVGVNCGRLPQPPVARASVNNNTAFVSFVIV